MQMKQDSNQRPIRFFDMRIAKWTDKKPTKNNVKV